MVYLNRRNIIKFEWDFGKPSNSNDATLAGDNLLKACAVFEYDRDPFSRGSCAGFTVERLNRSVTASQDYLDAACEAVCPLQPACGHLQAMSGVFSIASHSVLQYFPEVTLQEQTG